eukprot:3112868-Pyramimonas_sp.AAC.1
MAAASRTRRSASTRRASRQIAYPPFVPSTNRNNRIGNIRERQPIVTPALGISANDHQSERPHWEYPRRQTWSLAPDTLRIRARRIASEPLSVTLN